VVRSLGGPDFHHISGTLRAHSIIIQDIFGGADHFGPRKNNSFPARASIKFESNELILQISQDLDQMSEVFDWLMVNGP
jgi:hypothetical protein